MSTALPSAIETGAQWALPDCPLALDVEGGYRFSSNAWGCSWKGRVDASVEDSVETILFQLASEGYELAQSMTLDLYGQAWGAVVFRESTVLMVCAWSAELDDDGDEGTVVTIVSMGG